MLAREHLDVGPSRFGLLLTAIALGAAAGPLVLQRVVGDIRRPEFLFGPYLLRGVVDLVLATFSSFAVAFAALFFYGVGTSTGNVTYNTALQKNVVDCLRGRVFAFYDIFWQSFRLISLAVGGVLADRIGIASVYFMAGTLLFVAGALGVITIPRAAMSEQVG